MVRYALVIGISEYESKHLENLPKAATDGEKLAQVLDKHGQFQVERLPKQWNEETKNWEVAAKPVTKEQIIKELKTFLWEKAKNSEALIYFAGHGLRVFDELDEPQGFLTASDCKVKLDGDKVVDEDKGIALNLLNRLIKNKKCQVSSLVMLLDCCHSGFWLEDQSILQQTFTAFSSQKKDAYLIAACRSHENARAFKNETHSIFTGALLKSLAPENASDDGKITCDLIFNCINRELQNSGQEPRRLGLGRAISLVEYPGYVHKESLITPSADLNTVTNNNKVGQQILELLRVLNEDKYSQELSFLIERISSLLDVLISPLVQVVGSSFPFTSIGSDILKLVAKKNGKEATLEMCVILVSQSAYLESLRHFFKSHPDYIKNLNTNLASNSLAQKIVTLGEELQLEKNIFKLDEQEAEKTLICFHESILAKEFNKILVERLQESGFPKKLAKISTERISRNTYRYMKPAFAEIRESVPRLASIYGDRWQEDLESYLSIDKYLKDIIAQKPLEKVFDEDFSFNDIYVPLEVQSVNPSRICPSCNFKKNQVTATRCQSCGVDLFPIKIIDKWARDVLLDERKSGKVLFIQAGPGRGKSVFCRTFANRVRETLYPIYTPILIRLRDITSFEQNLEETLSLAVDWDFATKDRGWLTDRNTRFLFLLDGFDELLLERGASTELQQFLDQVALFQQRCAENSERGHRVLITGRLMALYGIERLMPTNLERVEILPMDWNIQKQWFYKWLKVVDVDPEVAQVKVQNFINFLEDRRCPDQVKTLAEEPLLLYLLAVMHRDERLKIEMYEQEHTGGAKISIYEQAVEWVLEKQRTEAGRNLNLKIADIEDLRSILDEAGLCVVQTGHEYASVSFIESRLMEKEDEGAKKIIEAARKQSQENPLKNALAAFYLKSAQGADNSVEFFHKSFGEFLCAERIMKSFEDWTSKTRTHGKTYVVSTKELWWQIYDLFGYGHLTPEIVEYLMALFKKQQVDAICLFERLTNFYLCWSNGDFIETIEELLPQKKARNLQKNGIEKGTREVDIYTGLNIFIVLMELHRYGKSLDNLKNQIDFHPCGQINRDGQINPEEFDNEKLNRIIGYSECLGKFTFNQQLGKFIQNINLSHANLSNTNLSDAILTNANFSHANLSNTHLTNVTLNSANLSNTNLRNAILRDTNFENAQISHANLSFLIQENNSTTCSTCGYDKNPKGSEFCDACGAVLYSINNFNNADLSNANLSNADLSNADLSNADLSNADLSNANLSNANLSNANLVETDFTRANVENINLTNVKNKDRAIGLQEILTLEPIPDSLKAPATTLSINPITCATCGYDKNPKGSEFCEACGSELSLLVPSTSTQSTSPSEPPVIFSDSLKAPATTLNINAITCSTCGYDENPKGSEFCEACGSELSLLVPSTSTQSTSPSEPPVIFSDSLKAPATTLNINAITCSTCGYDENPKGSEFCEACGCELNKHQGGFILKFCNRPTPKLV